MQKEEIGNIIQKRREFLSLTQEDLAEMSGVTSKTVYLLEQGKGNSSLDTMQKIVEVLGMELLIRVKRVDE